MSEKLTGAEHTKLDDKFTHMEKVTDVFLEVEVSRNIHYSSRTIIIHQSSFPTYCSFLLIIILIIIIIIFQTEMYEKTRDILYPNPAVRVKQVSDKGIASIGVSIYVN